MKAQASLEFLVLAALILLLFSMSVGIYAMNMDEASRLDTALSANALCAQASSVLNGVYAMGGNSSYALSLSPTLKGREYSVWVSSGGRALRVDYGEGGASCSLAVGNVVNASGSGFFEMGKNASVLVRDGVLVVG